MKKIIIVGGGYSGIMTSLALSNKYKDITILERDNEIGKKILVTGNGRCNFWNEDMSTSHFHSNSLDDIDKLISEDDKKEAFKLFENLGVEYKTKNGYYYPYTNKASTIRDALLYEIDKRHIKVKTSYEVTKIEKIDGKYIINDEIETDILILSSGGLINKNISMNHYDILKKLGHTIVKPLPCLTKLNTSDTYPWFGVREYGNVSIYVDDKLKKEELGEIQFTKTGISGICVFNVSRYASIGLSNKEKVYVLIDFIPTRKDIIGYLNTKDITLPIYELLSRILNKELVKIILEKSHIKRNVVYKNLSNLEKIRLEENIKRFRLDITSVGLFKESEVTIGGVNLNEINLDTLESKINKNLYITGELLDIDGDCGGYNLGFGLICAYKVKRGLND